MRDVQSRLLQYLPPAVGKEIARISSSRVDGIASLSEVRLSLGKGTSVISHGERVRVPTRVSESDMRETVNKLCEGAVYAHRETLAEGYVSIDGGIRVGVCGRARYECERLVGVTEVSSLVFRIPTKECNFTDELYSAWQSAECGMLIYAPPGGGKTTALRALVSAIASGKNAKRVAVIDERCEFFSEDCYAEGINLLRGYKRGEGIEIALRTLSPEVIAVDEIGAKEEGIEMLNSLNSSVPVLATAHAKSVDELKKRGTLKPFLDRGIFDVFVGIFNTDGTFCPKIEKI